MPCNIFSHYEIYLYVKNQPFGVMRIKKALA